MSCPAIQPRLISREARIKVLRGEAEEVLILKIHPHRNTGINSGIIVVLATIILPRHSNVGAVEVDIPGLQKWANTIKLSLRERSAHDRMKLINNFIAFTKQEDSSSLRSWNLH